MSAKLVIVASLIGLLVGASGAAPAPATDASLSRLTNRREKFSKLRSDHRQRLDLGDKMRGHDAGLGPRQAAATQRYASCSTWQDAR